MRTQTLPISIKGAYVAPFDYTTWTTVRGRREKSEKVCKRNAGLKRTPESEVGVGLKRERERLLEVR